MLWSVSFIEAGTSYIHYMHLIQRQFCFRSSKIDPSHRHLVCWDADSSMQFPLLIIWCVWVCR